MSEEPSPLPEHTGRRPQTRGGLAYLVLLSVAGVCLVVTVLGPWRSGVIALGMSLLLAAVVRVVLPERQAGMLGVRRKAPDVLMLVLVGLALVALAVAIPNQPGA